MTYNEIYDLVGNPIIEVPQPFGPNIYVRMLSGGRFGLVTRITFLRIINFIEFQARRATPVTAEIEISEDDLRNATIVG